MELFIFSILIGHRSWQTSDSLQLRHEATHCSYPLAAIMLFTKATKKTFKLSCGLLFFKHICRFSHFSHFSFFNRKYLCQVNSEFDRISCFNLNETWHAKTLQVWPCVTQVSTPHVFSILRYEVVPGSGHFSG